MLFSYRKLTNCRCDRQVVGTYSTEARALALRLLEAISESLGLERGHMVTAMGRHAQHMAVNYYPPCPQPELTYGLPGHKDPNAITLLLQDGVSGLQIQRDGRWVAVNPVPNALVINIGDQLQVPVLMPVAKLYRSSRQTRSAILAAITSANVLAVISTVRAGSEQRSIQERQPPRDREQREREDLGADVLLPVAGHGGCAAGGRPSRLQALHVPGVLQRVLEGRRRLRKLPPQVQTNQVIHNVPSCQTR